MNKFKDVKYCIGPMSKNIVDSCIKYCNDTNNKIILIPSRRQIEWIADDSYVNYWCTMSFSNYVRSKTKNIYLERDHGGPGQGTYDDDGLNSLKKDCKYFDIIHIDPWKKYPDFEDGLNKTIELINFCYNENNEIYFEVATEEAIRPFTVDELNELMSRLKENLKPEIYERIVYLVIQSGTALKEGENIGNFNSNRFKNMIELSKKYNVLTKEHNGDWLSDLDIKEKFLGGLDALNIAPEFGMLESKIILQSLLQYNRFDLIWNFYQICYRSKKWCKWVSDDFIPIENQSKLIEICGHYVFNIYEFKTKIKKYLNDKTIPIDNIIHNTIDDKLINIHSLI